MIRISLPENFFESEDIQRIFNRLADEIWSSPYIKNIYFFKANNQKYRYQFHNSSEVKNFLLSPDFFEYKFCKGDDFWIRLLHLQWNTLLVNIMNECCQTPTIKAFRESLAPNVYRAGCEKLKTFSNKAKNVSELKTLAEQDPELNAYVNQLNIIARVFNYKKMLSSDQRNTILSHMDVPVCPYCNMNYTLDYIKLGKSVSTADIDHFYTQSVYPEYSLCLYNMVPACQICNSRLKLNKNMSEQSHIYPFRESFEGIANFHITNLYDYQIDTSKTLKLELEIAEGKHAEQVRRSKQAFQIEQRYQSVESYARELTDKVMIYTSYYQKELEKDLAEIVGYVSVKELVFGPEETESEFARRSLGKLKRDLLRQLKVYK